MITNDPSQMTLTQLRRYGKYVAAQKAFEAANARYNELLRDVEHGVKFTEIEAARKTLKAALSHLRRFK